ncbi:MAG: hypothetical protein M1822_002111, partial [Bathelium mastoideum]
MPQHFKANGYRCPTNPEEGGFQYAFQTSQDTFHYWHQSPVILDNFNTFMEGDRILANFAGNENDVLLTDVAGGRGHDLEAFVNKFPRATGQFVLQDLPAVISDIKRLNKDIRRQAYDIFTPQP